MDKQLSFAEKCFALCCKKNVPPHGADEKTPLSDEELITLQLGEWQDFWDRFDSPIPDFENQVVVDYGCGFGYDSLFVLQRGAKHVYCLEVSQARLKGAQELHTSHGFENVTYIDNTNVGELPGKIDRGVDMVLSRDVMEHVPCPQDVLDSMYRIVKPGGKIYIGFSPFYKSPYGPHFKNYCGVPWIHLLFCEQTVLNVFHERYGLPRSINSYQEIEGSGVNKLSYADYKKMLDNFDWCRESDLTNRFPKRPLVAKTLGLLLKLVPAKTAKELLLVNSYVVLSKLPSAGSVEADAEDEEMLVGMR